MVGQTQKDRVTEEEFLSRLASSDEHAWSEFYRLVAPQLGKFAAYRGAVDSEDVVQDVFLRFFAALREGRMCFGTLDNAQAYLYALTRNLVIDRFRRDTARCRDKMVTLDEFAVAVPPATHYLIETKEELELRTESYQRALAAWSGSERSKIVYVACVLRGRSVAEVAAELGIPANTVSQMKRRGLMKVRQLAATAT